jgi:hypothetical protein
MFLRRRARCSTSTSSDPRPARAPRLLRAQDRPAELTGAQGPGEDAASARAAGREHAMGRVNIETLLVEYRRQPEPRAGKTCCPRCPYVSASWRPVPQARRSPRRRSPPRKAASPPPRRGRKHPGGREVSRHIDRRSDPLTLVLRSNFRSFAGPRCVVKEDPDSRTNMDGNTAQPSSETSKQVQKLQKAYATMKTEIKKGHRRSGRGHRPAVRGPVLPRALRPARRPGPRQDADDQHARPRALALVQPHPVHA